MERVTREGSQQRSHSICVLKDGEELAMEEPNRQKEDQVQNPQAGTNLTF